jgi:hypothetical protein
VALKKFLRKQAVAERYSVTTRTVDVMAEDGRLPPPIYRGTRFPLWDEEALDKADRAALRKQRVPERQES